MQAVDKKSEVIDENANLNAYSGGSSENLDHCLDSELTNGKNPMQNALKLVELSDESFKTFPPPPMVKKECVWNCETAAATQNFIYDEIKCESKSVNYKIFAKNNFLELVNQKIEDQNYQILHRSEKVKVRNPFLEESMEDDAEDCDGYTIGYTEHKTSNEDGEDSSICNSYISKGWSTELTSRSAWL